MYKIRWIYALPIKNYEPETIWLILEKGQKHPQKVKGS